MRCGYHGWHDWCVEVKGYTKKLWEDIYEFRYNDLDELEDLLNTETTAAIMITPVGHPLAERRNAQTGFLEGVRALADKYGVLVFDEIRSGFRYDLWYKVFV